MVRVSRFVLPIILSLASIVSVSATTPVEAFIARMKTNTRFVTVANLWQADNNFDKKELLKYVEDAQPLAINYSNVAQFMQQKNSAVNLTFPSVNGGYYTLELGRYDFLSNEFQVHAKGLAGTDELVDYTPGLYYSGVVKGYPGSLASFSFFNNEVYGFFSIPNMGNFVLVPNSMVGKEYDHNPSYLLYNDIDLKIKNTVPGCATDELPEMYGDNLASKTTTFVNNKVYNSCTQVRVFEVADYDTYVKKGSNVSNVTNYITALFNNQSTIYRNEGVPIVLKYLQVNTASDEYMEITSALSRRFLYKFGWVTQNVLHGCDLALLVSTRFGGMGGVAWVKAMCKNYSASDSSGAYGFCNINNWGIVNFPVYSWNLMVMCHEMGHILGSPHTHRCCWNPPMRNTAIDGCMTLEGSCAMPVPAYPSGGGTVMSYCHLQSVGINLSKGFGPQPGDTIRRFIRNKFSSSCGAPYKPTIALSSTGKQLSANRECTDISGGETTTYYWYEKNTAATDDDTLVLMVRKNGNDIGNLDSVGFNVVTGTSSGYSSGTADTMAFPSGISGASPYAFAMRRYWHITPTAAATSPVTILFPFTAQDTLDLAGSVPGATNINNLKMYVVKAPINPSPALDSVSFSMPTNVSVYTKGSTASTTDWELSNIGGTLFAKMEMTDVNAGGSGFYNSYITNVSNLIGATTAVSVFPNPTNNAWFVSISGIDRTQKMTFNLYSADGRLVATQELKSGSENMVNALSLPAGIYFYKIVTTVNVFTGALSKQ